MVMIQKGLVEDLKSRFECAEPDKECWKMMC